MPRRTMILVVALLAIVSWAAAPAQAREVERERAGCGGRWDAGGARCTFRFPGGHTLSVGGNLQDRLVGAASVRVEAASSIARGARRVLLECTMGGRYGGCAAVSWSDRPPVPRGTTLYCIVQGARGSGSFGCSI